MAPAPSVQLLGVPVDLYLTAARHADELVREFTLIAFGDRSGVAKDVPAKLLALVDDLRRQYARTTGEIRSRFEEAAARGEATVDLELPGVEAAAEMTARMTDILDAADEFCRSGELLTLAAPAEVVAWRHWWRDQVVSQVRDGADPTPWSSVAHS
ncbi:MAG: hypothetical protein JWP02_1240 [Acidimicrobiales bacterium]|nr:hypothetical protein [Acidimicrobiales bacterium]